MYFTYETAEKVLNSDFSSVVIDTTLPIPKEDFKAKLDDDLIKFIGVNYFEDDAVVCQPFYKLEKSFWQTWKNEINEYCKNGETGVYAENALNDLLNQIDLNPLDLKGSLCMEIDTKDDLSLIKRIIGV